MPIYENRRNAENLVRIAPEALSQVRHGFDAGLDALAEAVRTKNACCLLLDGWYGIDWKTIVPALQSRLNNAKALSCASIYYDAAKLAELKTEWITEDPCFGKVNNVGTLDDFIDSVLVGDVRLRQVGRDNLEFGKLRAERAAEHSSAAGKKDFHSRYSLS